MNKFPTYVKVMHDNKHVADLIGPYPADMFWIAYDVKMTNKSDKPVFKYWMDNDFQFICDDEIRPYAFIGIGGYDESGRIWLRGIQYKKGDIKDPENIIKRKSWIWKYFDRVLKFIS